MAVIRRRGGGEKEGEARKMTVHILPQRGRKKGESVGVAKGLLRTSSFPSEKGKKKKKGIVEGHHAMLQKRGLVGPKTSFHYSDRILTT